LTDEAISIFVELIEAIHLRLLTIRLQLICDRKLVAINVFPR